MPEKAIILIVSTLVSLSLANKYEKKLITNLMTGYDKWVRPISNSSHAIPVTFGLALTHLIDVDEKNQIITTNSWITETWIDHHLMWDPEDYNGTNTVFLPYNSVWLPDILLYNRADMSSKLLLASTNVIVTSKGNVTWMSTVIYKSSCTIDVRFFPFDEQDCPMVFGSWSHDGSQLIPMLVSDHADLTNYLPNGEFKLLDMHVQKDEKYYSCCEHPFPEITYYIHIRRKPMFFVFNMLLPCCGITLVALLDISIVMLWFTHTGNSHVTRVFFQKLGFCMPANSGEKVAMGITTLLSMTVFLMLVTQAMPPTPKGLPLIGVYYFTSIGVVSLATALTVCILNIHHKGSQGKPVPGWMQYICFKILAPVLCMALRPLIPPNPLYNKVLDSPCLLALCWLLKTYRHPIWVFKKTSHLPSSLRKGLKPQLEYSEGNNEKISHSGESTEHIGPDQHEAQQVDVPYLNRIKRLQKALNKLGYFLEKSKEIIATSEYRAAIINQWQQVALVADRLLLCIFVLLTIGVTLGLLLRGTISCEAVG